MDKKKDLTGLLLAFIGMIISLFIGFGFILTLIGTCMLSEVNENFRKSRNNIIGSLITSIAGFFVIIAVSGGMAMMFASFGNAGGVVIGSLVTFIIASIVMFILLYIFNRNAYTYLMDGCADVARDKQEMEIVENCMDTANKYKSALLAYTIVGIITAALMWVPILNVILMIATIGIGIWYLVMQIFLIVRVWQTYSNCK